LEAIGLIPTSPLDYCQNTNAAAVRRTGTFPKVLAPTTAERRILGGAKSNGRF
jgi:hypothetical protein